MTTNPELRGAAFPLHHEWWGLHAVDRMTKTAVSHRKCSFLPPKALIGVLHIGANPGVPFTRSIVEHFIQKLGAEAELLRKHRFDALLVVNHHKGLAYKGVSSPEMVASMTAIVLAVKSRVDCPVGVQFLGGENRETLAVAIATGAEFIRVRGIDTIAGAASLINYRKNIEAESVALFAEVFTPSVEGSELLSTAIQGALSFGADGIILSSASAEGTIDRELLRKLYTSDQKRDQPFPLLMGSGVLSENLLGLCSFADGFFIDSHIREEGLISKPIDRNKLDRLSVMAEQIRHTLA